MKLQNIIRTHKTNHETQGADRWKIFEYIYIFDVIYGRVTIYNPDEKAPCCAVEEESVDRLIR